VKYKGEKFGKRKIKGNIGARGTWVCKQVGGGQLTSGYNTFWIGGGGPFKGLGSKNTAPGGKDNDCLRPGKGTPHLKHSFVKGRGPWEGHLKREK